MKTISVEKAKRIASEWHSGQWSELYQFASSGKYLVQNHLKYLWQVQQCLNYPEYGALRPYDMPKAQSRELEQLKRYFVAQGNKHGLSTVWRKHSTYGYPYPALEIGVDHVRGISFPA